MKRLSSAQKADRTVAPRVAAARRAATVARATARTAVRSAITQRNPSKSATTKVS